MATVAVAAMHGDHEVNDDVDRDENKESKNKNPDNFTVWRIRFSYEISSLFIIISSAHLRRKEEKFSFFDLMT